MSELPSKCRIGIRKFQLLFLLLTLCHSSLIAANSTILTDSIISEVISSGTDTVTRIPNSDLSTSKNTNLSYVRTLPYDLAINSVPWITAGILLRSERHNFRLARNKFLIDFHNTCDDYSQFAPFVISTTLKAAGYEGRSSWGRYLTSSAASYGIMALLVNSIKYTARELRPDDSTSNSFPSGHTATAFTAATIQIGRAHV